MNNENLNSYTLYFKVLGLAKDVTTGEDAFGGIKFTIETPNTYTQEELENAFDKADFAELLHVDKNNISFVSKDYYTQNYECDYDE